ncbi:pectinesterase family protein, partial [Sinorhizobium sp. GL28]
MKKLICMIYALCAVVGMEAKENFDNPDTIVVARDGTGRFRNVAEAIEVCRAFMDYHKVIYVKKG